MTTILLLRKIFFLFGALLLSFLCQGQPISGGNPLGALPMKYNSSFAGQAGAPRLSSAVSYTNYTLGASWGNVWGSSFFTSYDQFVPAIASGIGVTSGVAYSYFKHSGSKPFNSLIHKTSLAIAPKISIKGKYTLSPSIDFTYNYYSNFGHATTMTPQYPSGFYGYMVPPSQGFVQSRIALLFNTNKYYIGYSTYFLNQGPSYDRENKESPFLHLSYLQMGYTFQRSPEANFSFTPQLAVSFEKKRLYDTRFSVGTFDTNLNFRYKKINWGYSRLYDVNSLHFGWQNDNLRIIWSNGFRHLGYFGANISSSLSFRYIFNNKSKQNLPF